MQPDVWAMSTGVNHARAVGLCADCRGMSELPSRPPTTVDQLRETTGSNAIAHVIYTSRTNRFPVNCPARRTHRHFKNKISLECFNSNCIWIGLSKWNKITPTFLIWVDK